MPTPFKKQIDEPNICIHIFTVSAGMVGVCLTVIGILKIVISGQRNISIADDLVAADAVLFMSSCFLSYWALRSRSNRMRRVERYADALFLLALLLMGGICSFITYAITFTR